MPPAVGGPPPGPTSPGSQTALRQRNERRILNALVEIGAATQVEIAHHTGLSAATVSNIVKVMARSGIVVTTPTTRSGRRALSVQLNTRSAIAVGVDFGRSHIRVALASYHRTLVDERALSLPSGHPANASIGLACDLLDQLLEKNGIDRESVLGVGVGVPAPVDRRTWTVAPGFNLPEWEGVEVLPEFRQRVGHPVYLDNDATIGALAEVTWGQYQSCENLVFVKVGSGIGCGLIVNGAPFYGNFGITGEIGHTTVAPQGPICWCGNRGCLETLASTTTILGRLGHGHTMSQLEMADVARNAERGDPATLRVLEDTGLALGQALADVANLLNPEAVVIGGPVTDLGDCLLAPVRRGLLRHALPIVSETTEVVMSPLGERAEALGAASLVLARATSSGVTPVQ